MLCDSKREKERGKKTCSSLNRLKNPTQADRWKKKNKQPRRCGQRLTVPICDRPPPVARAQNAKREHVKLPLLMWSLKYAHKSQNRYTCLMMLPLVLRGNLAGPRDNPASPPPRMHFLRPEFFSSGFNQSFLARYKCVTRRLAVRPPPTLRTAPASVSARPGILGPRRVPRLPAKQTSRAVFKQHRERGTPC